MTECVHQAGTSGELFLCRHFEQRLSADRCHQCPAFAPGAARPLTIDDPAVNTQDHCQHLGEPVADEPCSCGSATRISIHACHSPDRVRSWQDHAWCVPLSFNWDRLADPLAKTSFRCCEACEFHQASAALNSRYGSDDQHNPNSPPAE